MAAKVKICYQTNDFIITTYIKTYFISVLISLKQLIAATVEFEHGLGMAG